MSGIRETVIDGGGIGPTRHYNTWGDYDAGNVARTTSNRRGAKEFLRDFAGGFNQSWKDNRSVNNRGSATASAADRTGQSASKVASQFGQLGDDITIEKGYRDKGFTVAGTPGRKGILGHVARGVGTAFGGPFGAMAGNVAGSYLDYV